MKSIHRAFFNKRRGSFLVETMVALSLMLAGILGIVTLLTSSLKLTANVSQRAVAAYLAAEGVEITKHFIDAGFGRGHGWTAADLPSPFEVQYDSRTPIPLSGNARYLQFDDTTGLYTYGAGVVTPFRRTITVTAAGDEVTVNATVISTVHGTDETLNLEDHFFNWREP